MLATSVSLAGPVCLATNFFMPAGRTSPVVLDAKADASGNLVTAALADVTAGGQQIVITKFSAAGVRRWSSSITTPVSVAPAGQAAGEFQIQLDGVGNTYVLSPRASNPVISGTTDDLLVRKISDAGATVGYLSLVGYLFDSTGTKYNVTNAQMQNGPVLLAEVGLACTAVNPATGGSSAFVLSIQGVVSGSAITVDARGGRMAYQDSLQYENYAVVGLQSVSPSLDAAGRPRMRLVL